MWWIKGRSKHRFVLFSSKESIHNHNVKFTRRSISTQSTKELFCRKYIIQKKKKKKEKRKTVLEGDK